MSKAFHLVDPNQPGPSKETATSAKTDWSICLLCQEATPELLQCPAQSKRHDVVLGQGYSSLAKNIRRFNELQEMPMPIDLRRLDAGSGMEATMLEHQAKWHPSCNRKFNTTKLQRAEKRHATNDAGSPVRKKFTRQSTQHQTASKEVCLFCEGEKSGPLHEASTFDLNKKVHKCALDIQDRRLFLEGIACHSNKTRTPSNCHHPVHPGEESLYSICWITRARKPNQVIQWLVRPEEPGDPPVSVLVHNSSTGACHPIVCEVTEGRELWPLPWFLDASCPLVLFSGPHELCQMGTNPHQGHGLAEDDAPRSVGGVQPGSFHS